MKNSGSFHIAAQNIDCASLLEPPRSMFLSRNKKNNVYHTPVNPRFTV